MEDGRYKVGCLEDYGHICGGRTTEVRTPEDERRKSSEVRKVSGKDDGSDGKGRDGVTSRLRIYAEGGRSFGHNLHGSREVVRV